MAARSSRPGERTGAVALSGARPVLGAHDADVIVCEIDGEWYALDAATVAREGAAEHRPQPPRRASSISTACSRPATTNACRASPPSACATSRRCLLAAEAVGVAQWCVETAAEYAKVRVQFGRPIGQFQGVKHRCADMLARTELAAGRGVGRGPRGTTIAGNGDGLAIAAAAALAFDAAFLNGKDCVQTLGGIGFTWEHDAHLYLRRAITLHQLVGHARRMAGARRAAKCRAAPGGGSRSTSGRKPKSHRAEVRALLDEMKDLSPREQRERLAARRLPHAGLAARRGAATRRRSSCS